MSTFDAPSWFSSASWELIFNRSTVGLENAFNGLGQTVDLLAWYWSARVTLPSCSPRSPEAGAREAFFNTLAGGANKVRLHHRFRPVPLGTLRGSPTLASSVAQFADTLVLANAWDTSRQNLLLRSQEFDNAAWAKTSATVTANTSAAPDGSMTADLLTVSSSGAGARVTQAVSGVSAGRHTFSVYCKPGTVNTARLLILNQTTASTVASALINFSTGTFTLLTGESAAGEVVGAGWVRGSLTCAAASASAGDTLVAYIYPNNSTNTAGDSISAWGAQLERAAAASDYIQTTSVAAHAPVTLLAGDMVGVSPQLFQVHEDAVSNSLGQMTVKLVNRTRSSLASGLPVIWDRPTAEFMLPDNKVASRYTPNIAQGHSLEFREAP